MKHSGVHTTYRQALLPNDERVQNYLLTFRSLIAGIVSWRAVVWCGMAIAICAPPGGSYAMRRRGIFYVQRLLGRERREPMPGPAVSEALRV